MKKRINRALEIICALGFVGMFAAFVLSDKLVGVLCPYDAMTLLLSSLLAVVASFCVLMVSNV